MCVVSVDTSVNVRQWEVGRSIGVGSSSSTRIEAEILRCTYTNENGIFNESPVILL